jgi:flagellar hook-basal body protein
MPFNTALSGIRASNADLKITGNNIANASTVGFKASRAEFGDVYATTILGAGSNTIGSGVRLQDVAQQFTQGNISFTENSLDLAISGSGFFVLDNGGDQVFSRAGTLGLDKDGFIVNNVGANLQGFQADANGVVGGVLGDLQIQTGNQPPRQTTSVESTLNLDATEEVLQRSGTTFVTDGNAIAVSQVGLLNDTTSTLLSGSFNLPLVNDFSQTPITFDVQLSGATSNNGTVSVELDNDAGVPAAINTFNDLRTLAGVINSQLFSPTVNSSQDPIDVIAVAVDDGGGDYHLEFQSLIPGESSQVSVTGGNTNSPAVTDQAATVFSAPTTDFSAIDPPAPASASGSTIVDATTVTAIATGGASTVTITANGTSAIIDIEAAAIAADAVTGGINNDDVNELVTQLNAQIGGSALAGQIQAVNNNFPAGSGSISFETVATGAAQTLSIDSLGGADSLGLTTPLGLQNTGSDGAGFEISVNGTSPVRVIIGDITSQSTLAQLEAQLNARLDTAVGSDLADVHVDAATGRVYFETNSNGASNTIQVTSVVNTDILGLQGASGSPNLVNALYRGGDAASILGLPTGGGRISDSSGQAAVDNAYPTQAIDITDPDGNVVTYTAVDGNSAAETASEMNALSGVSATATTSATLSSFTNVNGNSVLTLNNVALTGDDLQELETQINALTTSTLPGISATYDATTGTLAVQSSVGDDLVFEFSSSDDGDSIAIQGDTSTVGSILEADPLNDGTSTATVAQTPNASTVMTGSENWWTQVPSPTLDLSVDGQGFVTVDLSGINNNLTLNGTTPVAGTTADNALATAMSTTFDLTTTTPLGVANVDLTGFVDGTAVTPAQLQTQIQAAVDAATVAPGDVIVNMNPNTFALSFSTATAGAADSILLDNVGGGLDSLNLLAIQTAMGGAADFGAAPDPATTLAAIQSAVDTAAGAGNITVGMDPSTNQIYFETGQPGINHSVRITNVSNDVLGLGTVPNLVGTLYQGADGASNRAEGVNGNPSAVVVGGAIDIVLDEGYTATDPTPPAIGLFGPFTATTFQPFVINQFDPNDQATYNHATSVTVYDSLGNSHIATQYFVKQPYDPADPTTSQNHWHMHVLIDGADVGDPVTTLPPPDNTLPTRATFNLFFNQDGTANTLLSDEVLISNWEPLDADGQPNGALGPQNQLQGGTLPIPEPPTSSNFEIDLSGTTQFGSDFAVNDVDQNGFTTGRLSGISIDDDGIIFARFTNGEAQTLGQIALAEFANAQGLQPVGDTMWAENFESGVPNIGTPGTAALGVIQSGAVEESNVDLSEQLVNLIIAQRNFQANSKTIETANQTTQTIINLR